ncbi:MAG: dTMP kinase [Verrucomicrobia bacterium]|nr:dTMP kinase [Verrucomicrobiota bacterium]
MSRRLPGGLFVAIEGVDGAGKSTQASLLAEALRRRRLEVALTREPTDGPWGRKLRESARSGRLSPEEELEAFLNDRREHVSRLIRPSLEAGKVVITDRYYFSTAAYQGARGFDPAELMAQNEAFAVEPDLLALLDLSPEESLRRIGARGGRSAFESIEQLRRAREIYLAIRKPYLLRLDASLPAETLRDAILFELSRKALARWAADAGLTPAERVRASLILHGAD